jgi:hypothetical protein
MKKRVPGWQKERRREIRNERNVADKEGSKSQCEMKKARTGIHEVLISP